MTLKNFNLKKYLVTILIPFLISLFSFGVRGSQEDKVFKILDQLGFQRVFEEAKNFKLPLTTGVNASLDEYKGKWIFLNFWATWCGPCRQELPTLEGLFLEFKDQGLEVLGVSSDSIPSPQVDKFLKKLSISFPSFHDQNGQQSVLYQASSLPSLYLISPDWKILGVFRGARDWEAPQVLNQLRELIKIKGPFNWDSKKQELEQNQVTLEKLAPPLLKVSSPIKLKEIGGPFSHKLEIKIKWPGPPGKYLIKTPQVTVPKEVIQGSPSSEVTGNGLNTELVYSIPLKLSDYGSYRIGPIEMKYQNRKGGAESISRHPGIDFKFKGASFPSWILFILGSIFGLLSIMGSLLFFKKKKGKNNSTSPSSSREKWSREWEALKELKRSVSEKDYSVKLISLIIELDQEKGSSSYENLEQLLEMVQYGGLTLEGEKVKYFEKIVIKETNNENVLC